MATIKEVQLMQERDALKREVGELQEKVASFERKEAAESVLVEIMSDPRAALSFKPTTASDFLHKRAQLENLEDMKAAKSAIKMAQVGDFAIGDGDEPGDDARVISANGSRAEQEFEDWLVGKESGL
jgi:hypothetical protein